ncbi:hypothetical protein BC940DRAFT_363812 [Gongronella butleri]|nr:hypothetical protein BC940DRAFT_363812 [Gongronella butleri]
MMLMKTLVYLACASSVYGYMYSGVEVCTGNTPQDQCSSRMPYTEARLCVCVKGTRTYSIRNNDSGNVKIFSTTDCTGNYGTIAEGSEVINAQWVNSVSYGASGSSTFVKNSCSANWAL